MKREPPAKQYRKKVNLIGGRAYVKACEWCQAPIKGEEKLCPSCADKAAGKAPVLVGLQTMPTLSPGELDRMLVLVSEEGWAQIIAGELFARLRIRTRMEDHNGCWGIHYDGDRETTTVVGHRKAFGPYHEEPNAELIAGLRQDARHYVRHLRLQQVIGTPSAYMDMAEVVRLTGTASHVIERMVLAGKFPAPDLGEAYRRPRWKRWRMERHLNLRNRPPPATHGT